MKKILIFSVYIIAFGFLSKLIYSEIDPSDQKKESIAHKEAIDLYQKKVEYLGNIFDLPPSYLMALIMLESSGKKNIPSRYEKSIYKKLSKLKKGKIKKFENITQKDIKKLNTKQLKALSRSYGPYQIMGYKCFFLNISLKELTGKKNIIYATKWIDTTYGDYLRKGNFKDAFHIHNTGERYPKKGKARTHDPNYIKNGLEYEKYFRKVFK